ncbi:protein phosphatase 2C domain-containing protein [Streptomyces sp. NPDC046977]|uniref:protein phosphatase 2C domain-containing protein n=1 Tax=Streptomyces sp. NPDC046977 TaxID=3154703 RepID=UPI0033EB927C
METLVYVVLSVSLAGNALLLWAVRRRRPGAGPAEVAERIVRVEVPGPERVVQVPGPERMVKVEIPGPERIVRVEVPGPERVVRVGPAPEFGPGPFPLAVPGALALGRDGVHDTVVDGADLGPLHVRGGSLRGGRHRADQRFRRDAFLTRTLPEFPRPTLLSAVAAGNPLGLWSRTAAELLCESLGTQLDAFAKPLDTALADDASPETVTDLLRTALRGTANSLERLGHRHQADTRDVSADVLAVLSPLGETPVRRHLVLGTGTGVAFLLRDGAWHPVLELSESTAWSPGRALPAGCELRHRSVHTRPGDVLVLCTGATAELIRRPDVAKHLADAWTVGSPDLLGFLQQSAFRTAAADTDRTLVCLWETA